jgi:hypothetical protein
VTQKLLCEKRGQQQKGKRQRGRSEKSDREKREKKTEIDNDKKGK